MSSFIFYFKLVPIIHYIWYGQFHLLLPIIHYGMASSIVELLIYHRQFINTYIHVHMCVFQFKSVTKFTCRQAGVSYFKLVPIIHYYGQHIQQRLLTLIKTHIPVSSSGTKKGRGSSPCAWPHWHQGVNMLGGARLLLSTQWHSLTMEYMRIT